MLYYSRASALLLGLLFCAFFACPANLSAVSDLSFSQALSLMRKNSDLLEAASAGTDAKKQQAESLKTLWGPTITAQVGEILGEAHVKIDQTISTTLGSMPVDISENRNFSGPRAAISGTWPLFTGGKIRAQQKASQYSVDEAQATERAVSLEQDMRLIVSYFGMQLAASIEAVRNEMLDQQERELARARQFEAEGMISQVERMSVQVARDKSEREWLKSRDAMRIARIELASLLGSENYGKLATPLFVLKKIPGSVKDWVDASLSANPRIAVTEAREQQAEQGVAAARGNFSPDIFAFGSYSLLHPHHTIVEPQWMAGIGLNLTIWDAKGRVGQYRSARASSREAKAMRADATRQARTDTEVAWQNVKNALERWELTSGNVTLARENLLLKIKGFEEGLNTALDMTDARTMLAEAQVERKLSAYEFVVNLALLHALSGKMEDFIKTAANKNIIVEQ